MKVILGISILAGLIGCAAGYGLAAWLGWPKLLCCGVGAAVGAFVPWASIIVYAVATYGGPQ